MPVTIRLEDFKDFDVVGEVKGQDVEFSRIEFACGGEVCAVMRVTALTKPLCCYNLNLCAATTSTSLLLLPQSLCCYYLNLCAGATSTSVLLLPQPLCCYYLCCYYLNLCAATTSSSVLVLPKPLWWY